MNFYQFYTKLVFSWLMFVATMAISTNASAQCNNVTSGGTVCCNQASNTPFDAQPILEVTPAAGGGNTALEYLWLYTSNPYNTNFSQWNMVPGGNSKDYDPGLITSTTYFVRCARRAGCSDYVQESNIVIITVSPCDNITDPGKIGSNQIACLPNGNDPAPLSNVIAPSGGTGTGPLEYAWYKSTVGGAFNINSSSWSQITGANSATYDPPPGITQTTYYVRVSRRNSCVNWLSSNVVSVTVKQSPTVTSTTTSTTCFGGSNGSINLTVTGGTPPYTYSWNYGQIPANTQNPTNIPAGTYTVTVTDANTCMAMPVITVNQPPSLAIAFNPVVNVKCYGDKTGSAVAQVTGGTPPYFYQWSNGASAPQNVGLAPGKYYVTVTDVKGCVKVGQVDITSPTSLNATTSQDNVKCFGDKSGTATVSASGGTAPYTYFWSNGQTTATAVGLGAGIYTVSVKDANNCSVNVSVIITEPTSLSVTPTKVDPSCNGANSGSVSLSVSGGTTPYSYNWSNGATNQNLTNLGAGTYSVTVTDANGCKKTSVITLNQPNAIVATISSTNAKCNGDKNGTAVVTVTGGVAPYTTQWNNNALTPSITGLSAGTYTVTVTDNKGCTKVANVTITEPTLLVATSTGSALVCGGAKDGTASVQAAGGTAPYKYKWSNGATASSINGLSAGTYNVTVTDANGCIASTAATVTQPATLDISTLAENPKCYNGNDGSIELTVSGGTAPYTYSWSNGATTSKVTGLIAGTYTVTVTDSKGCAKSASIDLTNPDKIKPTGDVTNIKCNGSKTGAVSLTITGGSSPYTIAWSNGANTTSITNLSAGNYTATITDSKGCTTVASYEVKQPAALVLTTITNNVKCNGQSNGSASIQINGGVAPYSTLWSTGATTNSISGLLAGTYGVTVTDANGCVEKATIEVNEPTKLDVSISSLDEKCFGQKNGSANVSASGGTAPYTYKWSNGSTLSAINSLAPSTYTATVTDKNNCTATGTATIKAATLLDVTSKVTNVLCKGEKSGAVSLIVLGGASPYSYNWSNGETSADISGLNAGVYSVTVTDANGCTKVIQVTVTQPAEALIVVTSTTSATCSSSNGSATATALGGVSPYTYKWSNAATTSTISNVAAGNYVVTVTDANSCTKVATVTITQPSPIIVYANSTNVSCNGKNDGSASASVTSGGTAPYTFQWSNGVAGQNQTGLVAGTYTVTATDAKGCTGVASTIIIQPTAIVLTPSAVSATCKKGNDGTATVAVTGGSGAYTYLWSNGATTATITGLTAETYYVTVTDSNGCSSTTNVKVLEPLAYKVQIYSEDVDCYNGTDGLAKAIVTGGPAGGSFTVLWSTGETSLVIGGLSAGTYTVTITDSKGCVEIANTVINQPTELQIVTSGSNPKCNGDKNGSASVTSVSGGHPAYTYVWSNFATTQTITGVGAGTYAVTVKDANGCTKVNTVILTEPTALVCSAQVTAEVQTYNGNQGEAIATASGGTAPYAYKWSNGATTAAVTGLTAGTYNVTITDANGCKCSSTITLMNLSKLGDYVWFDKNGDGIQDANESGLANVTVTLTGTKTNGTPVSATLITDNSGMYMFDGLMAGTYKVTFKAPNEYMPTVPNSTFDTKDSDVDPVTMMTQNYTLGTGEYNSTVDAGYFKKVKIGDFVWFDKDKDGIQDSNETGFANIMVKLYKAGADNIFETSDDVLVATTTTDNTGMYMFSVMPGMKYQVEFMKSSIPAGYDLTKTDEGTDDSADSDAKSNGRTHIIMVMFGQNDDLTIDAGLYVPCNNVIDGGLIGPKEQILCGPGVAGTINSIATPTGGAGTIEYLWLQSTKGPNYVPGSTDWTPIPGTNSPSYAPGFLTQTTWFLRCSRRAGCDAYPGESNIVVVYVNTAPKAQVVTYPNTDICTLTMQNFVAFDAGVGATYSWNFGFGAVPQNATGKSVANVMYNSPGQKTITLTVSKDGCVASTSVTVNVLVCPGNSSKVAFLNVSANPVQNQRVDISWETVDPTIDNLFLVERSKDGLNWSKIATVDAKNFAVMPYTFVDQKPAFGSNNYRIRHIDLKGAQVISNAKNATIFVDVLKQAAVYPNPFTDVVNVELTKVTAKGATVQIVNAYGQVVKSVRIPGGQARQSVDLSELQSGFYLIRVDFGDEIFEVHKITRQQD